MARKAKPRRQVGRQGFQKHKTGRKLSQRSKFSQLEVLLPANYRKILFKTTERCFKFVGYCCCKLCFAPISVDTDGKYVTKQSRWELTLHNCLVVLQCTWIVHQLVATVTHGTANGMDLAMVLCISSFLVYITGFSLAVSLLFKRNETIQLLNTLPTVMQYHPKNGKKLGALENLKSVLVVLGMAVVTAVIAFAASTYSFLVPSFPASLYHIFEMTGIPLAFPAVPPFVWKLLIWPAEMFLYSQSMILCAWASMIFLSLPNIGITWTDSLRKIPVDTSGGVKELWRRYLLLQVFIKLCNSWVKFMIVPTITSICGSIVITLFITIRYTDLPIMLYLCFPYVAFTDLFIAFWVNFEVINLIRETEAIQHTLMAATRQKFLELTLEQRLYLKSMARATRTAGFDIGDLMDYNMDVPIGMWDEILNQLFFLLTL